MTDFENESEPAEVCQRCHGPIPEGVPRFVVRIDADPPLSRPVALWVCGPCVESLTRWARRRGRGDRPPQEGEFDPFEMLAPGASLNPGSSDAVRAIYAEQLDRNERWIHRNALLAFAGVVAVVGLAVSAFVTLLRTHR